MYHVTVSDSDGNIISESDGRVLLLAHHDADIDGGVRTLGLCDNGTAKEQLATIVAAESMRDDMIMDNKELLFLYAYKDEFITGKEKIDFSSLRKLLKGKDEK